jgi:hypothetical protein
VKLDVQVTDLRIGYVETTRFEDPVPTFVRAGTSCDVRVILNGKANAYQTITLTNTEEEYVTVLLDSIASRVRAELLSE